MFKLLTVSQNVARWKSAAGKVKKKRQEEELWCCGFSFCCTEDFQKAIHTLIQQK